MPRRCTVCEHEERPAIDAALLDARGTNRSVSKRFGLSAAAVFRHRQHIPMVSIERRAAEVAEREGERAKSLAELWLDLHARAQAILARAEAAKDDRTALLGIRELTRLLDMPLKHAAELRGSDANAAPLHEHRDWPSLVAALCTTLAAHPSALDAVRVALGNHGSEGAT